MHGSERTRAPAAGARVVVVAGKISSDTYPVVKVLERSGRLARLIVAEVPRQLRHQQTTFDVDPTLVRRYTGPWALALLVLRVLGRVRRFDRLAYFWRERLFDRFARGALPRTGADALLCDTWSCRDTLRRARALGLRCILRPGGIHPSFGARWVRPERERLGLTERTEIARLFALREQSMYLADGIIALSSVARTGMIDGGLDGRRIRVAGLGVDTTVFAAPTAPPPRPPLHVVFIGGGWVRKGVRFLLDAWREAALGDAQLWLCGPVDRRVLRGYEDLAPALHTPGWCDARAVLARSHVFVFPSLSDSFARVVPEAMASGLPVIVSENVGAKDLVEDGVNGFVVPVQSASAIAERLRQLADDEDLRRHMGERARASVLGCTPGACARQVVAVMDGLLREAETAA